MTLVDADAALRIATITVVLLLAALSFRERRALDAAGWLSPPLAFCLAGFVAGNTPFAALHPTGAIGAVAHVASGFAVVFLWWFCLACFEPRWRPRGLPLAGGLAWAAVAACDRGLLGDALADRGLSRLLVAIGLGIVVHLCWTLTSAWRGDLIETRRDARAGVTLVLGGMLLVDLTADLLFGFAWRPAGFAIAQNAILLWSALWLGARLLRVNPAALVFREPAARASGGAAPRPAVPSRDVALRARLDALIERERIHLDPALSFADFARRLGASERNTRALVNRELGFDHFRTFLNHHRLAEARRRLRDPARRGDKLIAIAMDSGFASLASFNRVFLAAEGCSPGRFRDGAAAAMPPFEERRAAF